MKLLVSGMDGLSGYVSREFHYIMQDLIHIHGWRHIEPWVLAEDLSSSRSILLTRFGQTPDVILFWETYALVVGMLPQLLHWRCRTCMFVDDLHSNQHQVPNRLFKLLALSLCNPILSPYAYLFDHFYPELRGRKHVVWTPHSASPDFALPFNKEPDNRIFLSGAMSACYPLRLRMKEIYDRGSPDIRFHPHPGYGGGHDYANDPAVGRGYAYRIQSCRAAFTDALTYRYVVAKYFEIPATGALLLADDAVSEPLGELGFQKYAHYIPVLDENLESQIKFVLEKRNHREVDAIRKRGQQLVLSRHKTRDRARLIDEVCSASSTYG
jgi:hypothetical protein